MDAQRHVTILIADPDRSVFESAARALLLGSSGSACGWRGAGRGFPSPGDAFEVIYARDGTEAFRDIHVVRPDIVFIAPDLPVIDGATLVRTFTLSPIHSARPFVALVRAGDGASAGLMREAGVQEVIAKPFDGPGLRARVQEILFATRATTKLLRDDARRHHRSATMRSFERT